MEEQSHALSAAAFARHAGAVDPAGAEPGRISSRLVYDGRVVHLSVDTVRFPDGSIGELEIVRHSGAAAVLPVLDPEGTPDPRILLVRQYRYASGGELLEVPAGRPDFPGEDWEACARRELEEEAALRAARLVRLGAIYTTPGFTDERIHLFLAFDVSPGTQALDADEFVEPVVLRLSEALARVGAGEIVDAKTICTLHLAARRLAGPDLSTRSGQLSSG
ncbi:MAG TPA: NUDIX hydrolase [Longimicrobiales bacterium]